MKRRRFAKVKPYAAARFAHLAALASFKLSSSAARLSDFHALPRFTIAAARLLALGFSLIPVLILASSTAARFLRFIMAGAYNNSAIVARD
jgi:hypothetical protein